MSRSPALASLYDGKLTGKREQEILTPDWILDALREEWGTIKLDPCSNAERNTGAETCVVAPDGDGLLFGWDDRTYVNPPFGDLKSWLAKARKEAEGYRPTQLHDNIARRRVALLCPVRTHRPWYRDALDTVTAAIELPPIKFKGYDAGFPAPLHLLCWNWTPSPRLWRGTVRKMVRVT